MNVIAYIQREWEVVGNAPITVLTFCVLAVAAGYIIARFRYRRLVEIAEARATAHEDDVKRLARRIEDLKSTADGPDQLAQLRAQIESMPRIHFGKEPPANPREGDLWFSPE